jgi:hypothetical protein
MASQQLQSAERVKAHPNGEVFGQACAIVGGRVAVPCLIFRSSDAQLHHAGVKTDDTVH